MGIESRGEEWGKKNSKDNKVKRKERAYIIKDLMYHPEELKSDHGIWN